MPIARRWMTHKSNSRKSPLTNSIKKHGAHNFKIEEIALATSMEEMHKLEIYYIKHFNSLHPNGYNLSTGGEHSSAGHTPWNKGKKGMPAPKSCFKKGHATWNKGVSQLSEETKKKQSLAKLGKHLSPETEFKAGQPSAFKGKKHTPEAREKIAANNSSRAIKCVETGAVFRSMLQAATELNIGHSYLQRLLKSGKQHKKTGLSFVYLK